jgi:flagellar FliL protein
MKADPKAAADAGAAPPKAKSKMMIIIIAVVLLAAIGGGAAWFMTRGGGEEDHGGGAKKAHKAAKSAPPEYVALESFTVNLQPENGADQYLQVQMTLQVAGAEQVELFKTNMAKVRNRVLLLLSSKKASEISTIEGKKKLAEEIVAATKEPFVEKGDEQEVSEVLFTSFIIQ